MSVRDRFMALEQGRSPRPVASMLRQYRTPPFVDPNTGLTVSPVPAGARLKPEPPMMRPASPTLSPMMQNIIRQAQMKKAQAASGTGIPSTTPPATTPPAGGQPSGFMGAFSQPLTSPVGQAISQAAIAGARASDWSPTPVSLGRVLAEMGAAASEGYAGAQDRELKNLLTQAQIAEKLGTAGQFYKGSSVTAQDRNIVLNLAPKIKDGTATDAEKSQYRISYQTLTKPIKEERRAPDGTITTVQIPGLDLSNLPTPSGLETGERVIGQQEPTFNNDEKLAGAFTNRMIEATQTFENVTSGGYDPANIQDYAASKLPLSLRATAMSDAGQQYLAAKINFITAVLRKESGAAISATEFENEDMKYFPQPGESAATIEQKRLARKTAIDAMKAQSGGAFDYLQKKMAPSDVSQLPKGSVFIERKGGKSFYRTPDNKVMVVE